MTQIADANENMLKQLFMRILTMSISLVALSCSAQMRSVDFDQVLIGFNGVKETEMAFYLNSSSLERSWIRKALSDDQYYHLISKVNFDRQAILVLAAGERTRASGAVRIERVRLFSGKASRSIDVSVAVGVLANGCTSGSAFSYPFVVAIFDVPNKFDTSGGYETRNYVDDECKSPMHGRPTN